MSNLTALATFKAFTPHPLARNATLARRFSRRALVGVTLGSRDSMEVCLITFSDDALSFSDFEHFDFLEEGSDAVFLRTFAEKHQATECVFNVNYGFTATRTTRARPPENDEAGIRQMMDEPEKILGENPDPEKRYAVIFHPTHRFAFIFAFQLKAIRLAEELATRANLQVARIGNGVVSVLVLLTRKHWDTLMPESEVLVVENGSVFQANIGERQFGTAGFNSGMKGDEVTDEVADRMGKRLEPNMRLVLVNGTKIDVPTVLSERDLRATIVQPLAGMLPPGLSAMCLETSYDLSTHVEDVRPFAHPTLRVVPVTFWAIAAASVLFTGVNFVRQQTAIKRQQTIEVETAALNQRAAGFAQKVTSVADRVALANTVSNWLAINPPAQSLLLDLTKALEPPSEAQRKSTPAVGNMSITTMEGLAQLKLVVVVLTDDAQGATNVFQRISAMLGRKGFKTVDFAQKTVPGGFQYEHILNMPKK